MKKNARLGTKTQIDLIYYRTEGQTLQAQQQTQKQAGLKLWKYQSRFNAHNIRTERELNALEKLETITAKLNAVKQILKGWK